MSTLINLRQIRKQKQRAENRATGDANAARFGESKASRNVRQAEAEREQRKHSAHELDRNDDHTDD